MAIRSIISTNDAGGDAPLRKRAREVTQFNARLHELLDDMRDTLFLANGLGLAAPQVGVLRRVVLVVETNGDEDRIIEMLNPEIVAQSGVQDGHEGCLSMPGVYAMVKRPQLVKVKAHDRDGGEFEVWGEGLTARAMCHEIDHLDGVMFADKAERFLTAEEMEQLRQQFASTDDEDDYEDEEN